MLVLTYWTLNESTTLEGIDIGGLEVNGQFVFCAIVTVVNLKVLISSSEFGFWSIMSVLFCVGSYYVILLSLGFLPYYTLQG